MTRKNPYENQDETLDIPDFVEEKTKTESSTVDMSIFKMSDDELYDDVDETEVNEDGEYAPRKKMNTTLLLSLIINLILLAACVGAIIYALNQHKAYVKANTDYQQIQASQEVLKQQINERDLTIDTLTKQIEDLQKAKESATGKYRIVDGPVTFRSTPTKNENPSNETTYQGKSSAEDGDEYDVIEIVEDKDLHDELYWAKVADDVYFCIGNQKDEIWAKKVD